MHLSIIIPTYNTKLLTARCIEAIYRHPPSKSYEVIVVDNHSQDGTVDLIRTQFPAVRIIQHSKNLGFSPACNAGSSASTGEYLLFLNSDTEAQPDTFDELMSWLDAHPKTGIVGPALKGADGDILQMSWVWHPLPMGELIQQYFAPYAVRRSKLRKALIRQLQRRSGRVPSISAACLMIRRQAFDQIKGFDNDFELYFEDSDLCLRCVKSGWQIDFVAESRIVHHLGQSTRGSFNSTSLIYQQSHITFYRKHAAWAVYLLKLYLMLKWLRLRRLAGLDEKEQIRLAAYCRAYRQVISEKRKITLEEGIPA